MAVTVQDPDLTVHVGDVRDILPTLPAESVDCVACSPPYWGLRDYGTGQWDGGDPDCDHLVRNDPRVESSTLGGGKATTGHQREGFRDVCGRCGARRVDRQLGLEPTPEEYVANMVSVFRDVRRVLRPTGTLWLNLGDSYASNPKGNTQPRTEQGNGAGRFRIPAEERLEARRMHASKIVGDLKPKDLVGIPWRLAFALQADGWYLRSDIIWSKPNPMPESVTDRPTKAHEYVFLLSKSPRYWFDQEAVRESHTSNFWRDSGSDVTGQKWVDAPPMGLQSGFAKSRNHRGPAFYPEGGRNVRSVWEIATQPYTGAHFATWPEALAERILKAGCPEWVCGTCRKPRERIVKRTNESTYARIQREHGITYQDMKSEAAANGITPGNVGGTHAPGKRGAFYESPGNETVGWSDCGHGDYRPGTVLDPFGGSGTTALVARRLGRRSILIELNEEYAQLAAERCQQLSLLA